MKDWNAKWIMFEECPENTTPVFRKEFCLEEKPAEASLDICGLGFYLLEINGMRVGEELLQPAFTAYDKTVLYNTHDVTDFLAAGNNEIRVTLGNGWFHEPGEDCFDFEHAVWKNHPQMICRLYADGRVILRSDSGWQCREGKWSYNSVRFGETYDAGAEEKEWRQAAVAKGPGGLLKKQKLPGIRIQEYREPMTVKDKVYDFGCNLSGDVEITLEGKQGETVEIVYGERLDARGGIDQTLIKRHGDIPRNQIDYYRKGKDGEETWHPEFSYKGFRYVQVKGDAAVVQIKARVFYTDLQTAGGFQCPDVCLQRIYDASLRSVRTNFHHIPTDCPHREKNGWTGDAHMSCEFALLNLDMEDAYLQYLDSLTDCQWPSGQLPCIAPTSVYGYNYQSGPTWDAALIFIPWQLYRFTGKTEILERYYEAMKKYLHYTRQISEEGICRSGLGDFLPDEAQEVCPAGMILSCFIMRMAQIMEQISGILGKEDGNEWQTLAAYIRKAVIREYYGSCRITESYLSCVLFFGLSEHPEKEAKELAGIVREKEYRAGGGIFGSIYTLEMLTKYGYLEDALRVAGQKECPGWAYMLQDGGNSLWEHWNGKQGSLNHHMRSAIGAWMFKALTGLVPEECEPGWRRIVLRPHVTERVTGCRAWHRTPWGIVRIALEKGRLYVELPEGVSACVHWNGKPYEFTGCRELQLWETTE